MLNRGIIPVLRYDFPHRKKVTLLPLADLHFDARVTDRNLIRKKVREIKEKSWLTLLDGDLFDKLFFKWLLKNAQDLTLNEALMMLLEIFFPIKEQILGIWEGNHDKATEKATSFSLIEEFARALDVPLIRGMGILHLRVGVHNHNNKRLNSYIGLITHGWGGGRTKGSKANRSALLSQIVENVDFTIMGHVHDPLSVPTSRFTYDPRTMKVSQRTIRNIILPSFLGYATYAQEKGYNPGAQIEYILEFSGKKKRIEITEREMC